MPSGYGFGFEEVEPKTKNKSTAPTGLALIESLYFGSGPKAAQDQFQHLLGPEQMLRSYSFSENREPGLDVHVVPANDVARQSFSPPISWNAPYSLQLVHFGRNTREIDEYEFHQGEEIVIPIQGKVEYQFYWSPGGRPPDGMLLNPPASEGSILRINPQIPHQARAAGGEAMAWLVLRHPTNSPIAVDLDQDAYPIALRPDLGSSHVLASDSETSSSVRSLLRRRVSSGDLKKAGAYAMIAWGISDFIRDARQRTGRTATDMATQIGIDPSSLSRLEEAKTNISIEMLAKVCRGLRVGLPTCIDSGSWTHESAPIDTRHTAPAEPMLDRPKGIHALHPFLLQLPAGEEIMAPTSPGMDESDICSWIVLKGRVLLELPREMDGKATILDARNVLHFREPGVVSVHALHDSTIVQIVSSATCTCRSATKSSMARA